MKQCKRCNIYRDDTSFIQIIKRITYDPTLADEDGFMYFAKPTKLCCICREYLRDQQKRFQCSKKEKQ